jgi:hypothetical protein
MLPNEASLLPVLAAGYRTWVPPSSGLALLGHLLPEGRRGAAARPATSSPLGERVVRAKPEPGEGTRIRVNPKCDSYVLEPGRG